MTELDLKRLSPLTMMNTQLTKTKHRAKSLENSLIERVLFDPTNEEHVVAYLVYREIGRWTTHFHVEAPHKNVIQTIEDKLYKHFYSPYQGKVQELIESLNQRPS
jgi:hypothetical protein